MTLHSVRAIRVTRLTRCGFRETRCCFTVLALVVLRIAGRGSGLAATWTAPPPMIAPPQVQAHNFARAILTDMIRTLFSALGCRKSGPAQISDHHQWLCVRNAKDQLKRKAVNHDVEPKRPVSAPWRRFRPNTGQTASGGECESSQLAFHLTLPSTSAPLPKPLLALIRESLQPPAGAADWPRAGGKSQAVSIAI